MTHEPTDISEQNLDDWEEEARPIEIPSSTTKNARIKLLIAEVRRLRGYVISKEQVTEVITPIVNDFVKEYEIKFRQKNELIAKLREALMKIQLCSLYILESKNGRKIKDICDDVLFEWMPSNEALSSSEEK